MFCVYHTRPFAFKRQTEFNITLARARTHTHTHAPCIPQPVSNVRETLHTRKSSWCAGSTEQVKIQKKAHTKKKEHCKPAEEPKRSSSRSLSCLSRSYSKQSQFEPTYNRISVADQRNKPIRLPSSVSWSYSNTVGTRTISRFNIVWFETFVLLAVIGSTLRRLSV